MVIRETLGSGGDLPPGGITFRAVKLFGDDGFAASAELDRDPLGVRGEVVVPIRVLRSPGIRGHDQPVAVIGRKVVVA